ncbi:hypothetical protein NDK43_20130 [Neobacillus pocheonensis]|uniref:Uncharacterized protein n=1 Tax=Neobacillus pocheonensis TaxID=363869 RepID=A0ABT0WD99_9BACI|nr:hypothetical protein [Neobacillus pocheonensis]
MGKFFKSVGNSNLEIGDYEEIREEDFKKIPNPLGIIGDLSIENRLINLAKNQLLGLLLQLTVCLY